MCSNSAKENNPNCGHRQRLRKRFLKTSLNGFSEHEIAELLLTFAIPRQDVKPLAKKLLKRFGSLSALLDADSETLLAESGLGEASVTLILLVKSLCAHCLEVPLHRSDMISSPADTAKFLQMKIGGCTKEYIIILYLDQHNYLQSYDLIRGTADTVLFYPKEIAEKALLCHSSGVIVAHNHPTGIPIPSEEDIAATLKLKETLAVFDIKLHDHLIACCDKCVSILPELEVYSAEGESESQ